MLIKPVMRGFDKFGSGHYGASRGYRLHTGIDLAAYAGSEVYSITSGRVSKIGYPYSPVDKEKGHLRYVEVHPDKGSGFSFRYFYISPTVAVGDVVTALTVLGIVQDLTVIYPGITNHMHFEVKIDGEFVDPWSYLE